MVFGNNCNENMDNVYTFAAMIKSSAYVISSSCFLFSTLQFRSEIVNFLHVLLSFSLSIYLTSISSEIDVNLKKGKVRLWVFQHLCLEGVL
jgi:adenine C2-methylase RlmN of 23S rRNA A2503 and tRNA A37